jgi:hypothetical protein
MLSINLRNFIAILLIGAATHWPAPAQASFIGECVSLVLNKVLPNRAFNTYRPYLTPAQAAAFNANRKMQSDLVNRLRDSANPASTAFRMNQLGSDSKIDPAAILKMAEFTQLVYSTEDAVSIARKVKEWITSPVEALYYYQNRLAFKDRSLAVFQWLLTNEPLFAGTRKSPYDPHSLLEYSFEKETSQYETLVTEFWRPANVTETEWFSINAEERQTRLNEMIENRKSLVPTQKQTEYLGKLGFDLLGPYEFKHGSFEFQLSELKKQTDFAASILDETNGFHIHQVFEIPLSDESNANFRYWYKIKADELTLTGLEQGLHPSARVTVAPEPQDIHLQPTELQNWSYKFHTIGLRAGIYGPSRGHGKIKIGLEYRDVSRDLNFVFERLQQNAIEIENAVWEQIDFLDRGESEGEFFLSSQAYTGEYASTGLKPAFISELSDVDLTSLPLRDISSSFFYHTGSKTRRSASPAELARWETAKAKYIRNLTDLQNRIEGARVDKARLHRAIQIILTDWAKEARPSLLYQPAP